MSLAEYLGRDGGRVPGRDLSCNSVGCFYSVSHCEYPLRTAMVCSIIEFEDDSGNAEKLQHRGDGNVGTAPGRAVRSGGARDAFGVQGHSEADEEGLG